MKRVGITARVFNNENYIKITFSLGSPSSLLECEWNKCNLPNEREFLTSIPAQQQMSLSGQCDLEAVFQCNRTDWKHKAQHEIDKQIKKEMTKRVNQKSHLIANNCKMASARLMIATLASRIFWEREGEHEALIVKDLCFLLIGEVQTTIGDSATSNIGESRSFRPT